MTQAHAILSRLSAIITATGTSQPRHLQLLPSTCRQPIEQAPVSGSHRRFECLITGWRLTPGADVFGAGVAFVDFDVAVRVAYSRLGGDAGGAAHGGDRRNVNAMAGDDVALIVDALTDQRNYRGAPDIETTRIREISFVGQSSAPDFEGPQSMVQRTGVRVQAEVAFPL